MCSNIQIRKKYINERECTKSNIKLINIKSFVIEFWNLNVKWHIVNQNVFKLFFRFFKIAQFINDVIWFTHKYHIIMRNISMHIIKEMHDNKLLQNISK